MLSVSHITKSYGDFRAVNDVSFETRQGQILGLIGPNGAGKSTTIRIIMNILCQDSGSIMYNNTVFSQSDKDIIGYLPEERGLYKKEKVCDILIYLAQLKSCDKHTINKNIDYWLGRFNLSEWKDKKIDMLSKGMAQKIQFISTILHDPKIIVLDEPFSGLDPVSSDELLAIITELKADGKIVLFSTHVMEQAEKICDHIVMLNHGKKILDGSVDEIKQNFGENTVSLECRGEAEWLSTLDAVENLYAQGKNYTLTLKKSVSADNFLQTLVNSASRPANFEIQSFKVNEPSLHSIFVKLAKEESQ